MSQEWSLQALSFSLSTLSFGELKNIIQCSTFYLTSFLHQEAKLRQKAKLGKRPSLFEHIVFDNFTEISIFQSMYFDETVDKKSLI